MAKRVSQEEFERRIRKISPMAEFQILNYTTISKKCKIKCLKCKTVKQYNKASNVLRKPFCCDEKTSFNLAKEKIDQLNDFHFIKKIDSQNILIRHDKCKEEFKRNIHLIIKNPQQCPYCSDNKGIVLEKAEIQKRLDERFFGSIKILEYNAIRTQNLYKCLKCGLNFKQTQKNLMTSRGCPKCDRFKSWGERKISKLLDNNNIIYQKQVSFPQLSNGKQKFDFVVYKDKDCTQIDYLIECQGEQHFKEISIFSDSLKKIQERDQRKRDFCKKKNYKLYEIIYNDGKFLNLNILPFIENKD